MNYLVMPSLEISRIINGTIYYGVVKGKAEAAQEFDQRQQAGENVGLVESMYLV